MIQTDKKTKILFFALFFILCITVALTYYRTMITHNYYVIESAEDQPTEDQPVEDQ